MPSQPQLKAPASASRLLDKVHFVVAHKGDGLADVVVEAIHSRGTLARANSHAGTAADAKDKRYAEMVERFQIRRVSRSPSMSASGAIADARAASFTALEPTGRHSSVEFSRQTPDRQSSASIPTNPISRSSGQPAQAYEGPCEGDTEPRKSTIDARSSGSGRLSVFWWYVSWKRQLARDVEYAVTKLRTPISPSSFVSRVRLALVVRALTVHLVIFPLETAFLQESKRMDSTVGGLEAAVEIVLVVDFLLMFNTSFYNKRNVLVQSRTAIAKRYLRSWFLLDLASSVPVDLIMMATGDTSFQMHWMCLAFDVLVRSQRIVHVIRVARYLWTQLLANERERSMFQWLLYSRYSHLFRIAWIILFIVLIAHYLACGWKLLALATVKDARAISSRSPFEDYVANFYDVLQLLQGQGVTTTSVSQNIYATIAILMGSIVLAIIFGHVAILVSNFNANSTNYQHRMESVFAIMSKLQLPAPLRERIHQYYEHLRREYESLDGEIVSFSKGLSHTLELEVVLFKYMDLIMHVPFWSEASPDFQKQLMLHLSVRVYLPDDFIIRRGEVGEEFFMINRGVCELELGPDSFECTTEPLPEDQESTQSEAEGTAGPVEQATSRYGEREGQPMSGWSGRRANAYRPGDGASQEAAEGSSKSILKLRRGQSFGELALFMNYERTANVRALSYIEMCVLQRRDFQKILVKHPTDRNTVLTSMLTKTLKNNEATKVFCPLKAMVLSVFTDGENHTKKTVSTTHAALLIASAVNLPLVDESIKFGVGERLHDQLVALRGTERRDSTTASSTEVEGPSTGLSDLSDSNMTTNTASPILDTVQSFVDSPRFTEHVQQLELVQSQMAALLVELSKEVHGLRTANERLIERLQTILASSEDIFSKRRHSQNPCADTKGSSLKPPRQDSDKSPESQQAPFRRLRSASMSTVDTSRGELAGEQLRLPLNGEKPQETTRQARQALRQTNRRASYVVKRSLTATSLHSTIDTKPKPRHIGQFEGAALTAFNSFKSLLAAESEDELDRSPTKYADQLFEIKSLPDIK